MAEQFVIDASVVLAWCFEDEAGPYADAVLDRFTAATALAPHHLAVGGGQRAGGGRAAGADHPCRVGTFLEPPAKLPIVVEGETASRILGEILALAREHRLSAYDAA